MMSDGMDIWAVRCPLQRAIFLVASGYKRLHTLQDRTVTEMGIHSAHTCAWYSGVGTRTDKALSWGGMGWLYPWEFFYGGGLSYFTFCNNLMELNGSSSSFFVALFFNAGHRSSRARKLT